MASNHFGQIFRITTFGESHGKGIGVVIDGCPAGLQITVEEIQCELAMRSPGKSPYTSPRKEMDEVEILSGIFDGQTTGAPIALFIRNRDADSSKYEAMKDLYRPGHANYTYLQKYGVFDHRGGGRASARETAARVAAGAVAKKFVKHFGVEICTHLAEIGGAPADEMASVIEKAMEEGDSLGAILQTVVSGLPAGLGDPVYCKLEAQLASAMLSIPATKGFEIGSGFAAAKMRGSEHNDLFYLSKSGHVETKTNFAGGTLGGITTAMPLVFRVAFKPTSSIQKMQKTVNLLGENVEFSLPKGSRHDPCVAIRAVPIVEAMTALVIADAILLNRCAKL